MNLISTGSDSAKQTAGEKVEKLTRETLMNYVTEDALINLSSNKTYPLYVQMRAYIDKYKTEVKDIKITQTSKKDVLLTYAHETTLILTYEDGHTEEKTVNGTFQLTKTGGKWLISSYKDL